ncbi:hypothetical protein, partial [Salinibacterium sp.]|uniref:hypothetical protein n=1 Tax=Salinibacterium sp. TaxID=1915057 RepID=UPI00286C1A9E
QRGVCVVVVDELATVGERGRVPGNSCHQHALTISKADLSISTLTSPRAGMTVIHADRLSA